MVSTMNRHPSNEKGFTLIEMIVSLILIGIISAVAGIGLVQISEGYVFAKRNAETIQKVQIAMTRIVKELGAATAVTTPTATSVSCTRPPGPVTNAIALSGSGIQINGTTLIDNVTAFNLAYFDAAGATTATAANIRRIDITFTVTDADNHATTLTNSVNILESYW